MTITIAATTLIQVITLIVHISACIFSLHLYFRYKVWKQLAVMVFLINLVGVLFYTGFLFIPAFPGHVLSQTRALIQAVTLLVFSYALSRNTK